MKLKLLRTNSSKNSTSGMLYDITSDPEFMCYTLEDEPREIKVKHMTCIPAGEYNLALRMHGMMHDKYQFRFADIHVGMIELLDVPDFTDILIHCGTLAYFRIYKAISEALLAGEHCSIVIEEL